MEQVREIKSLNIIAEQYDNLVFLLVFQKQHIYKNVYIRVGYENNQQGVSGYFSTRHCPQEYAFTVSSILGPDFYIVPISLRKCSKFIYIEIINIKNETIDFIFQRATSVCNPYTALQPYTEIQVQLDEDSNLTHSQLVQDILNSSNIIDSSTENIKVIKSHVGEELCQDVNMCDKYNTIWIAQKNNPISIIWANEKHWNTVHDSMGNVNKRTAWPVYDCPQIVQGLNQIGKDMILQLLLHSTIKVKNTPNQGFINFGRLKAVALCKSLIREAINNHWHQEKVKVEYELLDVDNHFLQVSYTNVLCLHNNPYNIIHYPKLCKKLGIEDNYVRHIMFLLQKKQTCPDLANQMRTLYVRQHNLGLSPNKYPLQNTHEKLINALSIKLPSKHINELLHEIIYNTDINIQFDGISIVVTSHLLPAGVSIESNFDQIIQFENINIIVDLKNKVNKYIY